MDAKALLNERKELFNNAFQFKKNKRVPLLANIGTWKILDAGYKFSEAIYNYDVMEKIQEEIIQRYQFDAYEDFGATNPMRVTRVLGTGFFKIAPSDEAILVDDHHLMERDDYQELANNSMNFYYGKAFKRYCKSRTTVGEIQNAVQEFCAFLDYAAKISDKFINQYGAMISGMNSVMTPFEELFCVLRGIKNTSLDIRKCKGQMKETMNAMFAEKITPELNKAFEADYTGYIAPVSLSFLGFSVLTVDQFGELYWPYVKKILDTAVKFKKPVYCYCENALLRFSEYFQDIPKGVLLIQLEQDDIFEFRKKLPNIALAGGMSLDLLGHGTKEDCVNYAKKLVDALGEGFVLSQNKWLCYRNDAKRENLLAVNDFIRTCQY